MRITLTRTGGVAGIRRQTVVELDNLPPPKATRARQLVARANFFQLPKTIASPQPQPDRFQYELQVEETDHCHCVTVSEEAVPPALQSLLDWLREEKL